MGDGSGRDFSTGTRLETTLRESMAMQRGMEERLAGKEVDEEHVNSSVAHIKELVQKVLPNRHRVRFPDQTLDY